MSEDRFFFLCTWILCSIVIVVYNFATVGLPSISMCISLTTIYGTAMYYRQSVVRYKWAKDMHELYPQDDESTAVFDQKLTGIVVLLWMFFAGVGFSIGCYAYYEKTLTVEIVVSDMGNILTFALTASLVAKSFVNTQSGRSDGLPQIKKAYFILLSIVFIIFIIVMRVAHLYYLPYAYLVVFIIVAVIALWFGTFYIIEF